MVEMLPIAKIAQRDQISRQAVSAMVKRLAEHHGLEILKDENGRVVAVNVAQFDDLRKKLRDPSKNKIKVRTQPKVVNETYEDALRLKTIYAAARESLRLEEARRKLISRHEVEDAAETIKDIILAAIDELPNGADEIAAAVAREGVPGGFLALKTLVTKLRMSISEALEDIMSKMAPNVDAAGHGH